MDWRSRELKQYQALTAFGVMPDIPKREVVVAFRGDETEETYNLAVSFPAGIVAGLVMQLHEACAKIDAQAQDKAAVMQPVNLLGAQAANPIGGKLAVLLTMGGFQLPAMMSKEAALQIIAAFEQAIEAGDEPPTPRKQLS